MGWDAGDNERMDGRIRCLFACSRGLRKRLRLVNHDEPVRCDSRLTGSSHVECFRSGFGT